MAEADHRGGGKRADGPAGSESDSRGDQAGSDSPRADDGDELPSDLLTTVMPPAAPPTVPPDHALRRSRAKETLQGMPVPADPAILEPGLPNEGDQDVLCAAEEAGPADPGGDPGVAQPPEREPLEHGTDSVDVGPGVAPLLELDTSEFTLGDGGGSLAPGSGHRGGPLSRSGAPVRGSALAKPSWSAEAPWQAPGDDPLDLDLSGFDEGNPAPPPAVKVATLGDAGAGDGWERDRLVRSSHPVPATRSDLPPTMPPPAVESPAASAIPHAGESAGPFDLVERSRPSSPGIDLDREMSERFELGDYTGALRVAEMLLGRHASHPEARRHADESRSRLVQMYSSRLGDLRQVPVVAVPETEVRWLGLDHRAGFLLAQVDGQLTLEELIDVSSMPRLEVLRVLNELVEAGAIRLETP